MQHRETYNKLIEAQARGDGPINAMCACHAQDHLKAYSETMRPGDIMVIVSPDKCQIDMDHENNRSVCICNDDDNIDTSRIE